jgi:hypothetical protein
VEVSHDLEAMRVMECEGAVNTESVVTQQLGQCTRFVQLNVIYPTKDISNVWASESRKLRRFFERKSVARFETAEPKNFLLLQQQLAAHLFGSLLLCRGDKPRLETK